MYPIQIKSSEMMMDIITVILFSYYYCIVSVNHHGEKWDSHTWCLMDA